MQCNLSLLESSLADRLSEGEEEALAVHLAACPACRAELERLAGGEAEWSRISDVLRTAAAVPGTAFFQAIGKEAGGRSGNLSSRSLADDSDLDDAADDADSYVDFAVNFLDPARVDGAIGSLADIDVLEIIGRGGMGIVLKGFQPELNRPVAVKVLAPHLATSGAARKRFAREAQAAAAIVHPNVMPILTVSSTGRLPYLVMPYVACESLQQRLDREAALPTVDVLRIGLQIAAGLAAAHAQGLIHRDVKPANILLEKGVDRVMLTDFGLARAVDDASLTRTGVIAGTPQYMSPEQARGDAVDARSDQFSLGSVLYAMCTGRAPFRAETSYGILRRVTDGDPRSIVELNPETPDWLRGIVRRLHSKEPGQRFESVKEVGKLLERCLAHVQQPGAVPLPEECRALQRESARPAKHNAWLPRLASWRRRTVLAVLLAGACAAGFWMLPRGKVEEGPPDPAREIADRGFNPSAIDQVANEHSADAAPHPTQSEVMPPLPAGPELLTTDPQSNQFVEVPAWDDAVLTELELLEIETQLLKQEIENFWTPPDAAPPAAEPDPAAKIEVPEVRVEVTNPPAGTR